MTASVSQLAHFTAKHMAGAKGAATGSTGNTGGDGLGDFMALLDQLGITVSADGTASGDILALLGKADALGKDGLAGLTAKLDKLSARTDQAATAASNALLAALGTQAGTKDGPTDPATALAELLNAIEAKSDTGDDTPATTTDSPDMSQLLALISAMAAKTPPAPTPVVKTEVASPARAAAAKPATSPAGVVSDMMAKLRSDAKTAEGELADDTSISLADIRARFKDQLEAWAAARRPGASDAAGNGATTSPPAKSPPAGKAGPEVHGPAQAPPPAAGPPPPHAAGARTTPDTATPAPTDTGLIATDTLLGTTTTQPVAAATPGDSVAVGQTDSETLVQHHLDLARDTQWLDTLAKDIARAASSDSQLRFQLNPEHLGSLKVELINSAQGTSVKLTADTEAARSILADAQPRLIAEARAQGLRISEATVDLGGPGHHPRQDAQPGGVARTPGPSLAAEVEQDTPAVSGERYA